MAAVFAFVFTSMLIVFFVIKKTVGLRVCDADPVLGLNVGKHGNEAHGGFVFHADPSKVHVAEEGELIEE